MVTAVELGPDTCVLVRGALRGGDVQVSAIETLDPAAYPGHDVFTTELKEARRVRRLPRRARVVLWGAPPGAGPRDPAVQSQLAPLIAAGFRVERVVSPCDALAALARLRTPRPDAAIAWLAVDRAGVALVVARPGALLYSHAFTWDSSIGARGSQARLLQRYSLVSFLAPELRRAAAKTRERGARLDAIITCGNLPDLRSLTMPLIEELDLEVETLDSLDGLVVADDLRDRASDAAPAIRLACAAVAARAIRRTEPPAPRPAGVPTGRLLLAAALTLAVAGAAWLWYSRRGQTPPVSGTNPPHAAPAPATRPTPAPGGTPTPPKPAGSPARSTPLPSTTPVPPRPRVDASATAGTRGSTEVPPAVGSERAGASAPTGPSSPPSQRPAATPSSVGPGRQSAQPAGPSPSSPPAAPGESHRPAAAAPPVLTTPGPPPPGAATPARRPQPTAKEELLHDALPKVSTILVAEDRRLAMIDGRVLGVGDAVGRRVIAAIEPRAVVFREPSGAQIRVRLGGSP